MAPDAAALSMAASEFSAAASAAAGARSLADVFHALAPAVDNLCRVLPPPPQTSSGRLLAAVGNEAGLLFTVAGGRTTVEPWSSDLGEPGSVDTTVRFDSLETLQAALASRAAGPGLFMRRKIRLEGSIRWLEEMREALGPEAQNPRAFEPFAAELRAAVAAALRGAAGATAAGAAQGERVAWVPNEASDVCMKCSRPFTLLRRRHHCRGCGQLCCDACAPRRAPRKCMLAVTRPGDQQGATATRVCQPCLSRFGASATTLGSASMLSGTSFGSHARAAAEEAAGNRIHPDAAACMELEALREELEGLRRFQSESADVKAQNDVEGFWTTTVVVLAVVGLLLAAWRVWALLAWVAWLALLHYFPRMLARRAVHVFWAALVVGSTLWLARLRIRRSRLEPRVQEAAWLTVHTAVARFITQRIMVLGGFWTKFGQQLSVNPALPAPYLENMRMLQDNMPAASMEEVWATLREELGHKAKSISLSPAPPLGTASIAQVHKASWNAPGDDSPRDIVIKVQHRGAERQFRQDLWCAAILAHILALIDPEGVPDVRPLISKMKEVTINELDFRLEGENLVHARQAVEDAGADVIIPALVPELVTRRALAMEFVDGIPLSKLKEEMPHVDPAQLVSALVDHYGVQFAVDGHFNADPHPGNLMVERASGKLVVLDWGMCIRMPREKVDAYAKLFLAAGTSDVWALVSALKDIGLSFKEGEVFEPFFFLRAMRFALRDSKPVEMAREEMHKAFELGGEIYHTGPKRYQKSPVDVFSGEMLYFGKALTLLYSVSSQLEVHHPILQSLLNRSLTTVLGPRGGTSLPRQPSPSFLPALTVDASRGADGPLQRELVELLSGLYAQGRLLGAQLCVLQGGRRSSRSPGVLADIALGVRGYTQHSPVTASTRFNLLDISKLVIAIVMMRQVDAGRLKLSDRLADRWEEFRRGEGDRDVARRAAVTIEQVLSHTAGCWHPLPPAIDSLKRLTDTEAMMRAVAGTPCAESPGAAQRYHNTAYGYLCAGACRHVVGRELADLWGELAREVAAQAGGLMDARDLVAHLLPGEESSAALPTHAISSATLEEVSAMISQVAVLMSSGDRPDSPVAEVSQSLWGREHLLDSSLFGVHGGVATAHLPGMQAFGTARAVASLLQATSSGNVLSRQRLEDMQKSRRPGAGRNGAAVAPAAELAEELEHVLRIGAFEDFGLGAQLVPAKVWAGAEAGAGRAPAWGHMSQGGSVALVLPGPEPVVVSLLLNLAEPGSRAHNIAESVLQTVARRCSRTA